MGVKSLGGVLLAALLLVNTAVAASKHDSGLVRFDAFMSEVKTLEAFFTQEVVSENGKIGNMTTGTIKLSRPGKFHWEYANPVPQQIISNGKKVWIYDEQLEQVTIKPINSALGASPAAILTSSRNIKQDFHIKEMPARENMKWVELRPKSSDTDFDRILVGMDDLGVQGMDLYDQFGRRTMIRFQESRVNQPISPGFFNFVPPQGTDIIGG